MVETVGITGLRENSGREGGIEEPYWGPSKYRNEGQISKRNSVAAIYDRASVILKHIRPNISKEAGSQPVRIEQVYIKTEKEEFLKTNNYTQKDKFFKTKTTIGFAASLSFGSKKPWRIEKFNTAV